MKASQILKQAASGRLRFPSVLLRRFWKVSRSEFGIFCTKVAALRISARARDGCCMSHVNAC